MRGVVPVLWLRGAGAFEKKKDRAVGTMLGSNHGLVC